MNHQKYAEEALCLALNIYHEGRNTTTREQMMIAQVTINRSNLDRWPPGVCQVVYQRRSAKGRRVAQFSWVNTVRNPIPREQGAWIKAQRIAYLTIKDLDIKDLTNGATHFYSRNAKQPVWARSMQIVNDVSNTRHVFLKDGNED